MKETVNFNGFIQVAIIVKDIEKARAKWCELFGINELPEIVEQNITPESGTFYRGKSGGWGLKLCAIPAGERGFIIELHEPLGGLSTYQEFLDKHGEGVHHLGFNEGGRCDAVIKSLADAGYALRTTTENNSWTIVDTESDLGVNLNIKPREN
jgi:catechol 2,3-dioxygenase-like lactoylglutathione lyase family enzyme